MMRFSLKTLCTLVALLAGATAAHAWQTVAVAPVANGTVMVDSDAPQAGDVVTVTVLPDAGYVIGKADITVEATIDPGKAQAPPRAAAPPVGYFIDLEGEQPGDLSTEAAYTFVMPDEPFDVLVTARFSEDEATSVAALHREVGVTATRYVSPDGRVARVPFAGVNLVVTTMADGSAQTRKAIH